MTEENATHLVNTSSPIAEALKGWIMYLEDQGKSPHTVKAFGADIRLLESYLPEDYPVGSVTTKQINNFLDWLQNERGVPCSPKTLARRITSIKAFYRWLQGGGVVLVDPAEKVVQKSVISPLPTVLDPYEVDLALEAADGLRKGDSPDHRPYTLFLLLITTGLKKGETLNLNPEHIDLETPDGPTLFVKYPSASNRYKERKIRLTPEWVSAYELYAANNDVSEKVFPWSPRRLEYLLEDISDAANLKKHISFAMCRWTCSLIDYRSGMEPNLIRQKLGVSKIQWREIGMKLRKLDDSVPK